MKNNFETVFIQELLDSEFIFIKTHTQTFRLNSVGSKINFKNSSQFQILDLFELSTSLKQLIRILFLLKYSRSIYKSDFIIYIWCLNPFILSLANSFINEYKLFTHIIMVNKFPSFSDDNEIKKKKYMFVLGEPWIQQSKSMLDSYIINNDIFLVSTLNLKCERHELGFYKIQNDLGDYKKLLVLFIIIESIINHKKEKINQRVFPRKVKIKEEKKIKQQKNNVSKFYTKKNLKKK